MGTGSQPFFFSSPQSSKAQVIPEIKTDTGSLNQQCLWQTQRHTVCNFPSRARLGETTQCLQDPENTVLLGPGPNPISLHKSDPKFSPGCCGAG